MHVFVWAIVFPHSANQNYAGMRLINTRLELFHLIQHWQGFRWKCYTLVVATWNWALAKEQCEGLGGNLARIEDRQVYK